MFFCKFCKIFKNTFFIEQLRWVLLSINDWLVVIASSWTNIIRDKVFKNGPSVEDNL